MKPIPSKKFGAGLLLGTVGVVALIAGLEGGRDKSGGSTVYPDKLAGGLPTVCEGLTRHVTSTPIIVGEYWPKAKCDREVGAALITLQLRLERCFVHMPPQSVFDAATSHAWNNGVGATCGSVAMQKWRAGDWATGCARMVRDAAGKRVWSYVKTGKLLPNGKPQYAFVPGLANRRDIEFRRCMEDVR